MKNAHSRVSRFKNLFLTRWSAEDYPGGQPRFQLPLFAKDVAIFVLLPVLSVILFRACENAGRSSKKPQAAIQVNRDNSRNDASKSQIIDFKLGGAVSSGSPIGKKAPGTLVKLRLLNVVETYSTAPVHAQVVDAALGKSLLGGTLIGDATPDPTFERINISFHYARDPNRDAVAYSIAARALGLDGTLGLIASKKEAFFTRAVLSSGTGALEGAQSKSNTTDLKEILFRALAAGFVQEFSTGTQVEKNRSQVLALKPDTEFFAELTDFFPGAGK